MPPKPLNIALVGCGALAELYYAPALTALHDDCALCVCALIDPEPARRAQLARTFPSSRLLDNLDSLRPGDADLAIVASPPRFHAAQTEALLSLGLHVLCEKPMASDSAQALRMVEAAQRAGRLLSVGLFRRFFPSTELVHDLILGRALGAPLEFSWAEGGPFNWPAASPSFFQRSASSGGVFADVGAHVLDLLTLWFGEPATVSYQDDALGGLEANAFVNLKFSGNVTGHVRLSRDTAIANGTRIRFERGSVWFSGASADTVTLDLDGCRSVARSALHTRAAIPFARGHGAPAATYHQAFLAQLTNLARAIRGEEPLRASGSSALSAQRLIEHCYSIRHPLPLPWLSPEEQAGLTRISAANSHPTP